MRTILSVGQIVDSDGPIMDELSSKDSNLNLFISSSLDDNVFDP